MTGSVIALDGILPSASIAELRGKMESGGCSSSKCGDSSSVGEMPPEIWEKIKDHPCYSEEAHHFYARMHVAVAPACNIQCNYCNRKYDCANESRPGVVSERLSPEEAVRKVVAVANEVPQFSVLGVAGPGDAIYDAKRTLRTFELVAKAVPDVKFCVSTNGLALPDHVDRLADYNIDHVTITINMIDPEIGERIYPWIFHKHRRWEGRDAAKILHERQMEGLEACVAKGILVKVNSVMIPGINDGHLKRVNEAVRARGAFLHNVMPLISDAAHGTHFGLTGQRGPSPAELKDLQDSLGGGANLMKHCRQCRADAVGLLGEDRGQEFTLDKIEADPVYDPEKRAAYRGIVEQERAERRAVAAAAEASLAAAAAPPMLVAVATKGGGRVNQHFGHAHEFQIYEVDGAGVRFVGHRRADNYCLGGYGDDGTLDTIVQALEGVPVVLCAKIGDCPKDALAAAGIEVYDDWAYEFVELAAASVYRRKNGAARQAVRA